MLKYKIIIPAVLFITLLMPFITAQDLVYKINTNADVKRPCFNNGTFCSASSTCNITITEQDGDLIVDNALMTNQQSYHNITFLPDEIGIHNAIMTCTDDNLHGDDTFTILISPSGNNDGTLGSLIMIGVLLIGSIGIISIGFYKNEPIMVLLGGMTLTLLGLYMLLNGIGNYRNDFTRGSSIIVLGIASYVSIRTSVEMMNG